MLKNKSPELQLLIDLIKWDLGIIPSIETNSQLDWNKFYHLSAYHQLRHLSFSNKEVMSTMPLGIQTRIRNFNLKRAQSRLANQQEIKELIHLFEQNHLNPLLIKGELFAYYTLTSALKRESTDIDLIIPRNQVSKAAILLLQRGYKMRNMGRLQTIKHFQNELDEFSKNSFFQELHFDKPPFNIDLHWDLNNLFLPYNYPIENLFKHQVSIPFLGRQLQSVDIEGFFWSLLIHHGGKEYWLKLKDLADFLSFLKVHQNHLDWKKIITSSHQYGLFTVLQNGLWYCQEVFSFDLHEDAKELIKNYEPKVKKATFSFWIKANYWNNAIPRFKYEWILINSQGPSFKWWKYAHQFYLAYIEPNPFEWKRFLNLPRGFGFLNFLDKSIAWVFRK